MSNQYTKEEFFTMVDLVKKGIYPLTQEERNVLEEIFANELTPQGLGRAAEIDDKYVHLLFDKIKSK